MNNAQLITFCNEISYNENAPRDLVEHRFGFVVSDKTGHLFTGVVQAGEESNNNTHYYVNDKHIGSAQTGIDVSVMKKRVSDAFSDALQKTVEFDDIYGLMPALPSEYECEFSTITGSWARKNTFNNSSSLTCKKVKPSSPVSPSAELSQHVEKELNNSGVALFDYLGVDVEVTRLDDLDYLIFRFKKTGYDTGRYSLLGSWLAYQGSVDDFIAFAGKSVLRMLEISGETDKTPHVNAYLERFTHAKDVLKKTVVLKADSAEALVDKISRYSALNYTFLGEPKELLLSKTNNGNSVDYKYEYIQYMRRN